MTLLANSSEFSGSYRFYASVSHNLDITSDYERVFWLTLHGVLSNSYSKSRSGDFTTGYRFCNNTEPLTITLILCVASKQ